MSLAIIGDCHFHNWSQFSNVLPTGRNSRLQNCVDAIYEIKAWCDEKGVGTIVQVGDIFHATSRIDADVYDAAYQTFKDLADGRDLFILVGNHDIWGRDARDNSLRPFSAFATVVDAPLQTRIDSRPVTLFPFYRKPKDFLEQMHLAENSELAFAHQGLNQGKLGAFHVTIRAEVDAEQLPRTKTKWYLGHYHKPQEVIPGVQYVGSILQNDFGERDEGKSFIYLDLDTRYEQRVPIDGPQFKLFSSLFDCDRVYPDGDTGSDFLRIVCSEDDADDASHRYPQAQVQINDDKVITQRRISPEAQQSDKKLLQEYMEKLETDDPELLDIGMEALRNAQTY